MTWYSNHWWQFSRACKLGFCVRLIFAKEVIPFVVNIRDAIQTNCLLYRFAIGNPSWGLFGCLSMYLYVRHQYTDANYINTIEIILSCHVSKCRYLYATVMYPFVRKNIFHTIFTKTNNALEVLVAFSRVKITFQFLLSVCNCVNNCTQKSHKFGIQYIFVNKCNGHTQSYIIRLMFKFAEHITLISHLNAQGSVHSSNTYIMENMEAIVMRVLL